MPVFNGDIVLMQWWGSCFGQRIILDATYRWEGMSSPSTPTSATLGNLLTQTQKEGAFDITTSYLACLPPQYKLDRVQAQVIKPVRSAYVASVNDSGPGTYPSPGQTSNNTGVVTFRTENAGRDQISNRHIGPIPTASELGGLLTPAYSDLLFTLGQKLAATITSTLPDGTFAPIIYHRNGTPEYTAITNFVINNTVRVQRRRTVGLGI